MHRRRFALAGLGVASLGLMSWLLLGMATGSALGQVQASGAVKVTIVSVTAGKPTELGFKLSRFSALPAGTITFEVKNAGVSTHDFKICTSSTTSLTRNSCVGKATKMLTSGQSATLTVTLTKSGKYEYLCTVPGHAGAGMKGVLGIGVKVTPAASASASTASSSSPAGSTSSTGSSSSTSSSPSSGGSTPGGGSTPSECAAGQTIVQVNAAGNGDGDEDDIGAPSDGDGCL
jgi:uncharacterized cupredoxin-like copper-binding protein